MFIALVALLPPRVTPVALVVFGPRFAPVDNSAVTPSFRHISGARLVRDLRVGRVPGLGLRR
jgi:hypothetical protein